MEESTCSAGATIGGTVRPRTGPVEERWLSVPYCKGLAAQAEAVVSCLDGQLAHSATGFGPGLLPAVHRSPHVVVALVAVLLLVVVVRQRQCCPALTGQLGQGLPAVALLFSLPLSRGGGYFSAEDGWRGQ